jgi:hypothetical protein
MDSLVCSFIANSNRIDISLIIRHKNLKSKIASWYFLTTYKHFKLNAGFCQRLILLMEDHKIINSQEAAKFLDGFVHLYKHHIISNKLEFKRFLIDTWYNIINDIEKLKRGDGNVSYLTSQFIYAQYLMHSNGYYEPQSILIDFDPDSDYILQLQGPGFHKNLKSNYVDKILDRI